MWAIGVTANKVVDTDCFAGSGDIQQQLARLRVVAEGDVVRRDAVAEKQAVRIGEG